MKIRNQYVMVINSLLKTVIYKRSTNYNDTCRDSIVDERINKLGTKNREFFFVY